MLRLQIGGDDFQHSGLADAVDAGQDSRQAVVFGNELQTRDGFFMLAAAEQEPAVHYVEEWLELQVPIGGIHVPTLPYVRNTDAKRIAPGTTALSETAGDVGAGVGKGTFVGGGFATFADFGTGMGNS